MLLLIRIKFGLILHSRELFEFINQLHGPYRLRYLTFRELSDFLKFIFDLQWQWIQKLSGHINYIFPLRLPFWLELKVKSVIALCGVFLPKVVRF